MLDAQSKPNYMPNMLFRASPEIRDELPFAQQHFNVFQNRMLCPADSTIVGRYSCLPYYKELEDDLACINSKLINSFAQHQWIANFEYYEDLKNYTPETWTIDNFYSCDYQGPFVVKGRTNSRKHQWNKLMFAETRTRVFEISTLLNGDLMIGTQGLLIRKFVPLKVLEVGIDGLPFSNEWRFFFYGTQRLAHGFYWSDLADNKEQAVMNSDGLAFAQEVANIASQHTNFFVLDIAEKQEGGWILIEVNDGQQSGPSACDLHELYGNLAQALR